MTINIPRRLRAALYIITVLGSLLATYLAATGHIGADEIALWTGFTAAVAAIAGFNLTPPDRE